ncbi:MAG: PD-(D/E)XK nuclease family protein [Planctomycetia bacterium]
MPITRHFLGLDQPALSSACDYLISRYASGNDLDLSKVILVMPGRRAGRRILEILVQRAFDRWPGLQPPQIVTFDRFPELLYPQQKPPADELTQLLVWRAALFAVPARQVTAALPHPTDPSSVNAWMALCKSLMRQHNELAAEGLDFDDVFTALANSGEREEAERWKALRRIQAEYLMQMDQLDLWDTQTARLIAVEKQECQTECDVLLIATVDINRIVRQMLDQIPDRVAALIHASESDASAFDEYGCVIPEQWENRTLDISDAQCRITGTPLDQARTMTELLSSFPGQFRADDVTIGVADDDMVPTLLQALADAGVAGHWPVGTLLKQTRPSRLLNALAIHIASARDELPPDFATLADLVRHPDVGEWIQNHLLQTLDDDDVRIRIPFWLDELDQYTTPHLQMTPGTMLGTAPRRLIVAELCRAVESLMRCLIPDSGTAENALSAVGRIHPDGAIPARQRTFDDQLAILEKSLTRQLEKPRPLSEWSEGIIRLLATVYGDRQLSADNDVHRGIARCVNELQDQNERLRRIPVHAMPLCTAAQALQLLLEQISEEAQTASWQDDAIELMGWLDLPLDDAPVLVITGFNEGNVPESGGTDAFLPNSLRSRLNLKDNRRRYARDACALHTILRSRRQVFLIMGRTNYDGNPLAPGRLWLACEPALLPHRVRWFYEPEQEQKSQTSDAPAVISESTVERSLSGFTVPAPVNVPPAPEVLAVTAFREYLQCPYRYFLRRELRLHSVDNDVRELSASAFGNLIHLVLDKFGGSSVRHATEPDAIRSMLIDELHRQALGLFGRSRSATVSVQLKMIESRLSAFADWQAENAREGWRIIWTEQKLFCDGFHDNRDRPVRLEGRVDRIDRHLTSGVHRVIDYKTSETAEEPAKTHRNREGWVDLQLPLYRLLIRSLAIKGDVELGYVQLPGDLAKVGFALADWSESDLLEAETLARTIAAEILDLKITDVPRLNDLRYAESSRICQDTVIDRHIPWLSDWRGR